MPDVEGQCRKCGRVGTLTRTFGDGPLVCRECTALTLSLLFEIKPNTARLAVSAAELARDVTESGLLRRIFTRSDE